MNHVQMLHRQERADTHPVSDLKGHQAVSKPLLSLELRWDQRATGERLGNPLGILEGLDAAEY
jgi:hypothetical protein